MTSAGGVVAQPAPGRAADLRGHPASYPISAGLSAPALPFVRLSQRVRHPADTEVSAGSRGSPASPGPR